MLENIEDVKLFIEWCKEHKVKSFKSGNVEFELSELSFIDSGEDLVSKLKSGENPFSEEKQQQEEDEELMFWSST
jgi:hypothetical protein